MFASAKPFGEPGHKAAQGEGVQFFEDAEAARVQADALAAGL